LVQEYYKAFKEMLMAQDFDHSDTSVTLEVLAAKTLKSDQRLSEFVAMNKGSSGSTSGTKAGATSSTAAQDGPRDKLSVGDAVYMIGTDGRAKKGTIKKIDRNDKGAATPTVKWKDGTMSMATFKEIKKDNMPDIVVAPNPPTKPSKPSDAMDLDATGKGKKPIVCNTCGGKGHYANQCPSVLTWTKGLKGDGACGRTAEAIYTNASKGPIDQASEQVYALRAERLIDKAE
jgi:hypothetical protein